MKTKTILKALAYLKVAYAERDNENKYNKYIDIFNYLYHEAKAILYEEVYLNYFHEYQNINAFTDAIKTIYLRSQNYKTNAEFSYEENEMLDDIANDLHYTHFLYEKEIEAQEGTNNE